MDANILELLGQVGDEQAVHFELHLDAVRNAHPQVCFSRQQVRSVDRDRPREVWWEWALERVDVVAWLVLRWEGREQDL